MNIFRITDIKHPCFVKAWALYKESFPDEERRLLSNQTTIMDHPNYHFEVIFQGDCFLGIIFWWGFDDLRYIEHFAISTVHRGKGYGQIILNDFKAKDLRPILLEVELPNEEIKQRRIEFYERLGFHLTNHVYYQPAYCKGKNPIQLLLMSYPLSISDEEVAHFVKNYHPIIYA